MRAMCLQAEPPAVDQRTAQPDVNVDVPGRSIEEATVPEPRGAKRGKENDPDNLAEEVSIL
jgi:hypothetical protein